MTKLTLLCAVCLLAACIGLTSCGKDKTYGGNHAADAPSESREASSAETVMDAGRTAAPDETVETGGGPKQPNAEKTMEQTAPPDIPATSNTPSSTASSTSDTFHPFFKPRPELKEWIAAAEKFGDKVIEQETGKIAVIPEKRVYTKDTQTIQAQLVNSSGEPFEHGERTVYRLEKWTDGKWSEVPYAKNLDGRYIKDQVGFSGHIHDRLSCQPYGTIDRSYHLFFFESDWLTAGNYRILDWDFQFYFSLEDA